MPETAQPSLAILDVSYVERRARAACLLAQGWHARAAAAQYVCELDDVAPYVPGHFYRRELPCLLAVLAQLPGLPDIAVVDGYVWLASLQRPGLGAHLYEALQRRVAVVGVAKSAFTGVEDSAQVRAVCRGRSRHPLYVSAVGMDLSLAATAVCDMAGTYRLPDLLKAVDRLSKIKPAPSAIA